MQKRFLIIIFLLPLILVSTFILAREWKQKTAQTGSESLPRYSSVGDFQLTERSGEMVSRESLLGKVWVANFIFTRCGGPCPVMSGHMKNLGKALSESGVQRVSFSVDPDYDTPEKLRAYAERFEADEHSWFFLTGDKETIHNLSRQHFLLGVTEASEEEQNSPEHRIMHSTRFALVDRNGFIRGYYDSADTAALQNLTRDARRLAKASAS